MTKLKDALQIAILAAALVFVLTVLFEIGKCMPTFMGWCFIVSLGLCAVYAGILIYERSK